MGQELRPPCNEKMEKPLMTDISGFLICLLGNYLESNMVSGTGFEPVLPP